MLREATDDDVQAMAALLQAADDARVISAAAIRHNRRTEPERARRLELVAELDGTVVGLGRAGLDTWTSTEGAAWAFVTVESDLRCRGIGDALGKRLLDHLREVGATTATAFFRRTEEGERWAVARGWTLLEAAPLIALDPRRLSQPAAPPGYRCVAMTQVAPEAVYEAVAGAARDEPGPVRHDDVRLDDFLREWDEPDKDLDASTAVLDEAGRVVAFSFLDVGGERGQHGFAGTVADHRGRGLATAAKQRALYRAAQRGVTRVTTSNAAENAAMRAINRKLGFEPFGEHVIFGRDLRPEAGPAAGR